MTFTFLIIGIVFATLLLLAFLLDGIFDFLSFDFLDGAVGAATIFSFLAIFGFVGSITANNTSWGFWGVSITGLAAGVIAAVLIGFMLRFLQNGDSGIVNEDSVVGTTAYVVLPIPAGGYGKVKVNNSGHEMEVSALATNNDPIPRGTQVVVDAVSGPGVVKVSQVEN